MFKPGGSDFTSNPSPIHLSSTFLSLYSWKIRIPVEKATRDKVWDVTHSFNPSSTYFFQCTYFPLISPCLPFPFNDFKSFWLSFQSPFHLSLALLVCYRCLAMYLVLDVLYHPFRAILPNSSTRKKLTWLAYRSITGLSPSLAEHSNSLHRSIN